jgi:hypothetical protein
MNTSPTVRKRVSSATSSRSFALSLIAKEAAVLRMHAEALQQAASDVERAVSGGKGPHPPGPGPTGVLFSSGKGPHRPGPGPTGVHLSSRKGPHPPGPGPTGDQFAAVYESLGAVLQSAGALQLPIAELMKAPER